MCHATTQDSFVTMTNIKQDAFCTRRAPTFMWDIVLCVKVLVLPAAQCNVNSHFLGQVFASEPGGPEFESCRIPAEA